MTNNFSLLIKPASGDCNLRCGYCFYLPKRELFPAAWRRMDSATLEVMTRKYLNEEMEAHTFAWQGGEPTLMGLPFFKEAVRLQKRLAGTAAHHLSNAIQTNGTRLDDAWCEFFYKNKFLVGISIDGPAHMNDKFRLDAAGRGVHPATVRGVKLLAKHACDFNALTVVSTANQDSPEEVYNYLKSLGINFHQYIECVEFEKDDKHRRDAYVPSLAPFAVRPEKWGEFLCRVFDEWYRSGDCGRVSVRLFDSVISRLVTGVPTVCPMAGDCRNYLVVECDGSVYPCDFYVQPELKLGNVKTDEFAVMRGHPLYTEFGKRKKPEDGGECMACKWLPLCMGDCPKNRALHSNAATQQRSSLCAGWKMFYTHTIERFEEIAAGVR